MKIKSPSVPRIASAKSFVLFRGVRFVGVIGLNNLSAIIFKGTNLLIIYLWGLDFTVKIRFALLCCIFLSKKKKVGSGLGRVHICLKSFRNSRWIESQIF